MNRRIVCVVFEGGVLSLGSKIRFGHFAGYAVINIGVGNSDLIGPVVEVTAQSEQGATGYFLIPMDKVEGIEYCSEEHLKAAMDNFQIFVETERNKKRGINIQDILGRSSGGEGPGPEMLEFIEGLARREGVTPDENDEESKDGE